MIWAICVIYGFFIVLVGHKLRAKGASLAKISGVIFISLILSPPLVFLFILFQDWRTGLRGRA